jgi:DNA-binding MarR family transcriptional regulator
VKNANVLFCHSDVDDAHIPCRAFRVLLHLQRRIGKRTKKNATINPGIDSIAESCRLEQATVVRELRWLRANGFIDITKVGRAHQYKVLVSQKKLYVHKLLDDYGLTAPQMRVLAHASRLAGDNMGHTEKCLPGGFSVNKSKFARVCVLNKKTIESALYDLEEKELLGLYSGDSMYVLSLDTKFETKAAV